MDRPTLLVEGWRFHQHPYALVNQFQCLELIQRDEFRLVHRDLPYASNKWRQISGLFRDEQEKVIRNISSAAPIERPQSIFRIGYPIPFHYDRTGARRICCYGVSEYRSVSENDYVGALSLQRVMKDTQFMIITPSEWSREGFLKSGASPDRVKVVPHGYCPTYFHPVDESMRGKYRQELGWKGFVFLSVGSMTERKGIKLLLKAFAVIASRHPEAQLVLKSDGALYPCLEMIKRWANSLSNSEMQWIQPRLTLLDKTLSFRDLAKLYQAADVLVAPYFAAGTAATVLEAVACGLVPICTRGGPSDVFAGPDISLRIDSHPVSIEYQAGQFGEMLQPNLEHLIHQMETSIQNHELRGRAKSLGAEYVGQRFSWKTVSDQLVRILFPD